MHLIIPSLFYGIAGFFTGFAFGVFREIFLIPNYGTTYGHLLEFVPLVITISTIGYWVTRHWKIENACMALKIGLLSVFTLLALESSLALFVMDLSVNEYLASFNIFEGKLFTYGLLVMALMPWLAKILLNPV